jgi:hypothetical protein
LRPVLKSTSAIGQHQTGEQQPGAHGQAGEIPFMKIRL